MYLYFILNVTYNHSAWERKSALFYILALCMYVCESILQFCKLFFKLIIFLFSLTNFWCCFDNQLDYLLNGGQHRSLEGSIVTSQHEGARLEPEAFLCGVCMFSLCWCEIPLGALFPSQSKDVQQKLIAEAKLSEGVNVYLCGGLAICLGCFQSLWPKMLG